MEQNLNSKLLASYSDSLKAEKAKLILLTLLCQETASIEKFDTFLSKSAKIIRKSLNERFLLLLFQRCPSRPRGRTSAGGSSARTTRMTTTMTTSTSTRCEFDEEPHIRFVSELFTSLINWKNFEIVLVIASIPFRQSWRTATTPTTAAASGAAGGRPSSAASAAATSTQSPTRMSAQW